MWRVGGTEYKGTASRAAWVLSGRELKPGWVVARRRAICDSDDCCNPEHHRAGPKAKVMPKPTAEQRTAHRIGVTRVSRARSKIGMDGALQIRLSEATCQAEAAKWGVQPSTISQIRRGETWR